MCGNVGTCTISIHNAESLYIPTLLRLIPFLLLFHIHSPSLNCKIQTPTRSFKRTRKTAPNPLQHVHKLRPKTIKTTLNTTNPPCAFGIKYFAFYSRA